MAMAITPEEAQQAMIDYAGRAMHDANATRYLSAIGLVLLLYDHLLTLDDEVQLVWRAKPSFAKRAFLFNRYLVAGCLIIVAFFMNNFNDNSIISDLSCRGFLGTSSLLGVASIGFGNVLVLLRVITLWDRDRRIALLMTFGFLISFSATFGLMVVVLVKTLPNVVYQPFVHMCVSTVKTPELPGVWAAPMIFELLVLSSVCWNAFDRPRSRETGLTRVLYRDGLTFLSALTLLRTVNLVIAIIARPTLVIVSVFFVWAMTTLVLNRSLLNIQKAATARRAKTPSLSDSSRGSRDRSLSLSAITSKGAGAGIDVVPVGLNLGSGAVRSESPFGIEPAEWKDGVDLGDLESARKAWEVELKEWKGRGP